MSDQEQTLGFTAAHDSPVPYMQRLRDYYLALGYGNPYRWAQYADVPFTPLEKPLGEMRMALITTAAPNKEGAGDQGPGAPYNAAAKFYQVYSESIDADEFLGISHLGYDRKYSTADDVNSFFPLPALKKATEQGRIGDITPRYYGTPTNRSQVTTIETDCVELLRLLRADEADAALIVPN
jgi:D-proline reductase (dithiol) PrdB